MAEPTKLEIVKSQFKTHELILKQVADLSGYSLPAFMQDLARPWMSLIFFKTMAVM